VGFKDEATTITNTFDFSILGKGRSPCTCIVVLYDCLSSGHCEEVMFEAQKINFAGRT